MAALCLLTIHGLIEPEERRVTAVPLNFQRQHALQMLLRRPFAPLLNRLPDQPQDSASAPGISVKLDPEVPTILVLLIPNAMVTAG